VTPRLRSVSIQARQNYDGSRFGGLSGTTADGRGCEQAGCTPSICVHPRPSAVPVHSPRPPRAPREQISPPYPCRRISTSVAP
jgi:hypothetical protein